MSTTTSQKRVWFVTGSSTGFGRLLTELALASGDSVIATLRKPSVLDPLVAQYPKSQLLVLQLDVTKKADVIKAFEEGRKHFKDIDVVFSNAGWGIIGEVESTKEEDARAQFDVNFWGASYVAIEAVKQFRDHNTKGKGGLLLHMSSMFGVATTPAASYYCATKFAGEALIEGLAAECDPAWNVKVSILCPGWFKTPMVMVNPIVQEIHPAYSNESLPSRQVRAAFAPMMTGESPLLGDPEKLIKNIYAISKLQSPPLHVPLGKDAIGCFDSRIKAYTEALEKTKQYSEDLTF